MDDFLRRLTALIKKEYKQIVRDQSSFIIGVVIPIMMILLVGYGMSLDVKDVPVAVVMQDPSPTVQDMFSFMDGSSYFNPRYVTTYHEGVSLMDDRKVDALVVVPPDFTESLRKGGGHVQIILWGVDPTTAKTAQGYMEAGLAAWQQAHMREYMTSYGTRLGMISVVNRQWYNDANTSTWFFVPGLIVLIMTMVGVFLTTMVMAREWERGTLESLFVTPVKPLEIVLSKWIPYFFVSMGGFALCMIAARYLFYVPIRGSVLIIILASMIYLLTTLGLGLTISSLLKDQFIACQIALPTVMLSGFIFDLKSTPEFINAVGHIMPATYYMELLKTLFLVGNNWGMIVKNCTILIVYGLFFFGLSVVVTKKRLEKWTTFFFISAGFCLSYARNSWPR